MNEIVPAILTKDNNDLKAKFLSLESLVPRVQVDIIDGVFADNKTVDLTAIRSLRRSFKLDLHLMVKEPAKWINRSREVMADNLIAQVEMMTDSQKFLGEVVNAGMRVGLALDLVTPVERIPAEVYLKLNSVLLMAVPAGFSGQQFNSQVLEKIKKIKGIVGDLVEIIIDGGLNEENILKCKKVGANTFVVTTAFWEAKDLRERYQQLVTLIK